MVSAPPEPKSPDLVCDTAESVSHKPILLIVDDEEGPRQSLRIVFKEDYRLLLASNGREALELARKQPIHVAVVDIRMPGMSGVEVLDQLKQLDSATEVIILTAYETLDTARQALRLGACDYLTKPFDLGTVRAAVRRAMHRRQVSEQVRTNNLRLKELQREVEDQRVREEILRGRGEIYGSVLHDLNGPLTIISGFIATINQEMRALESLDERTTADFKERLEAVNRCVNSCIQITHRYLSFLRHGGGDPQGTSVNQTLQDMGDLLRYHPSARNHQLVFSPIVDDARVKANGTDLIQLLVNLAVNALQASQHPHVVEIGGVVCHDPIPDEVFRESPGERFFRHAEFTGQPPLVSLTVKDDGPGMSPEVVQRLFHSQFTTKPAPEGTGLGLSIVRRLVLVSKGALTLQTVQGVGTRFTIYLPLHQA
jgi:signal transduction histidine kinase